MTKQQQLNAIHESLLNGQRQQMVEQIDDYGLYDFWADFRTYLHYHQVYASLRAEYDEFADAVISYHRIKAR